MLVATSGPPPPPPPPAAYHHGLPPLPPPPNAPPTPGTPLSPFVAPSATGTAAPLPGGFEAPPPPAGPPELLPAGAGEGRPPRFTTGAPAGYFIWQGPRGSWLLRTTTGGEPHTFSGHVLGVGAPVRDVSVTTNALADRVRPTETGWAFSFQSSAHADGFTFVVEGARCAQLDLRIDAAPAVRRVSVGAAQLSPRGAHFVVCPRGQTP